MIENISKLRHILSKAQKRRVCGLGVMILISGLLETIGISAILPLVQAVIDRDGMLENQTVQMVCGWLGFTLTEENFNNFILLLLGLVIGIIVDALSQSLLVTYVQARFVNSNQFRTVSYMLEEYLNRPYEFYLNADIPYRIPSGGQRRAQGVHHPHGIHPAGLRGRSGRVHLRVPAGGGLENDPDPGRHPGVMTLLIIKVMKPS